MRIYEDYQILAYSSNLFMGLVCNSVLMNLVSSLVIAPYNARLCLNHSNP